MSVYINGELINHHWSAVSPEDTVGGVWDSVCIDVLMVLDNQPQLNVQTKPVEPLVEGGAQIQQVLNIECLTDFSDAPLLNIKFR